MALAAPLVYEVEGACEGKISIYSFKQRNVEGLGSVQHGNAPLKELTSDWMLQNLAKVGKSIGKKHGSDLTSFNWLEYSICKKKLLG